MTNTCMNVPSFQLNTGVSHHRYSRPVSMFTSTSIQSLLFNPDKGFMMTFIENHFQYLLFHYHYYHDYPYWLFNVLMLENAVNQDEIQHGMCVLTL